MYLVERLHSPERQWPVFYTEKLWRTAGTEEPSYHTQVWWGYKICSLNEPVSNSHMNVFKLNRYIQVIPNETQFNSFQRYLSYQTDICTPYPHLSSVSKPRTSTDTIMDFVHILCFKTKRDSKQYCVEMLWPLGLKYVKEWFNFYVGHQMSALCFADSFWCSTMINNDSHTK